MTRRFFLKAVPAAAAVLCGAEAVREISVTIHTHDSASFRDTLLKHVSPKVPVDWKEFVAERLRWTTTNPVSFSGVFRYGRRVCGCDFGEGRLCQWHTRNPREAPKDHMMWTEYTEDYYTEQTLRSGSWVRETERMKSLLLVRRTS